MMTDYQKSVQRLLAGPGKALVTPRKADPLTTPDARVAELVEAAYREGRRDGLIEGCAGRPQPRRSWEYSKAKAALDAGKDGG